MVSKEKTVQYIDIVQEELFLAREKAEDKQVDLDSPLGEGADVNITAEIRREYQRLQERTETLVSLLDFLRGATLAKKIKTGAEVTISFPGDDQPETYLVIPKSISAINSLKGIPNLIHSDHPLIEGAAHTKVGRSFEYLSTQPGKILQATLNSVE